MKQLRFLFYIFPFFILTNLAAQHTPDFRETAAPGSVHQQILTIRAGDESAELPVKIIKGMADGPVFTILAGIHGYEYPPIIAVQELMMEIQPEKLKGTVIIVPIANVSSFYGRSVFYNPKDGKNLNRVFPGKADGTISERLAHVITTEIIDRSTVFLDIHAGDASEDLTDFVCYYDNKETSDQTALARRLAECSGFANKVVYPFHLEKSQPAEYAFKQATRQGVTALSIEAGKLGNVQSESVERIKYGVYKMLEEMKMYVGPRATKSVKSVWLDGQHYIKSSVKGIFYSNLKSGDAVQSGQKLGFITDLFGVKLSEVVATQSGVILYKIGTPPVLEGESLFCVGYKK